MTAPLPLALLACASPAPDPKSAASATAETGSPCGPEVLLNGLDDDCDGWADDLPLPADPVSAGQPLWAGFAQGYPGWLAIGAASDGELWLATGTEGSDGEDTGPTTPGWKLAGPIGGEPVVQVERDGGEGFATPWIGRLPGAPTPAWWGAETWPVGTFDARADPLTTVEGLCCQAHDLDGDGVDEAFGEGVAWFGAGLADPAWTHLQRGPSGPRARPGARVGEHLAWVTDDAELVLTDVLPPGEHDVAAVARATLSGFAGPITPLTGDWNGDGEPDLAVSTLVGRQEHALTVFFGPFPADRTAAEADATLDLGERCGVFRIAQPAGDALGVTCRPDEDADDGAFPTLAAALAGEDVAGEVTLASARRFWATSARSFLGVSAEHDVTGDGAVDLVVAASEGLFVIPGPLW